MTTLDDVLQKHALWVQTEGELGSPANLSGAKLSDAELQGADLGRANLQGTDLRNADLGGANLQGANLRMAYLQGAYLIDADLQGALLFGANLQGAYLRGMDLRGTELKGARLQEAKLLGAVMSHLDLSNAELQGAELREANLEGADLRFAHLDGADLRNANMRNANLRMAHLQGAQLDGADFWRADLEGAYADRAIGNFVLIGEQLTRKQSSGSREVVLHGKARTQAKSLRTVQRPIGLSAFKKQFPIAFEAIKHKLQGLSGNMLTPELATTIVNEYGLKWIVVRSKWSRALQRVSPKPNTVLQLCIDKDALGLDEQSRHAIQVLAETSHRSEHPVQIKTSSLFTVGWIRYAVDKPTKTMLIEEVQSDVMIVRHKLKDKSFQQIAEAQGVSLDVLAHVIEVLKPFAERFYYDAMALVFDLAESRGYSVEMLTHQSKKGHGSPIWVYEQLPKEMRMRKGASKISWMDDPVWSLVTDKMNPVELVKTEFVLPKTFSYWSLHGARRLA